MHKPMTPTEAAINMLLDNDTKGLSCLAAALESVVHPVCPVCGSKDVLLQRDATGDLFADCVCGEQFDVPTSFTIPTTQH